MRKLTEREELHNQGYDQTNYGCPECGSELWEKITYPYHENDEMEHIVRVCPDCLYEKETYDA